MGALSEPRYRRYWLGSFASVGALQVGILGMGWLIATDLGASPAVLGYLGAAVALPTILVTLFGGVIADRMDRRHVMMLIAASMAVLLLLLATLVSSGAVRVWHVLTIAAVLGFIQGFDAPVRSALFPLLIEPRHMVSAVVLNTIMWQLSRLATPPLAGFAIKLLGTASVFYASTVGWCLMLAVMAGLRVPYTRSETLRHPWHEFVEGLTYIRGNRLFATLIPLCFAHSFFGVQYVQLMPLFALHHGAGAEGLGFLLTALGSGAVCGTLAVGRFQGSPLIGRIILGALFGVASLAIGFALAPDYFWAKSLMFLCGFANSVFIISSMTALQLRTPAALRGRVMGIYTVSFSLVPLGGTLGGLIADHYDERIALIVSAVVLLGIVVYAGFARPEIRQLRGDELQQDAP